MPSTVIDKKQKLDLLNQNQDEALDLGTPECLGAFPKLRRATISFVTCLSVCLSARNNSAATERIFIKFDI